MSHGLGSDWDEIKYAYDDIPAVYDRTNRVISLSMDMAWRDDVICKVSHMLKKGKTIRVLDAGAGTGIMSDMLSKKIAIDSVLLDYSVPMLKAANDRYDKVQGVFEALPFRDNAFDGVIMGFSFHAAKNMELAISELSRVDRGIIAIVGFGRSEDHAKEAVGGAYIHYVIPVLAYFTAGKKSTSYKNIYRIYKNLPTNNVTVKLLSGGFHRITFGQKAMGTIFQYVGMKRRRR